MKTPEGAACDNCGGPVMATQEPEDDGSLYCEACRTRLRMQAAEAAPSIIVPPCDTRAPELGEVHAKIEDWDAVSDKDHRLLLSQLDTQGIMGREMAGDWLKKIARQAREAILRLLRHRYELDLVIDKMMGDHERVEEELKKAEARVVLWEPLVRAALELISESEHPDHRHIAICEVEEMACRILEAGLEDA